jgi:hypothetical protein
MSFPSKLLRTQQGIHQINEQEQRRNASDNVVHASGLLKAIAGLGKGPAKGEKQNSYQDVKYVQHCSSHDSACRLPGNRGCPAGAPRFKHKLEETVKKEALAKKARNYEKCFAHFVSLERVASSRPEKRYLAKD